MITNTSSDFANNSTTYRQLSPKLNLLLMSNLAICMVESNVDLLLDLDAKFV